MIGSSFRGLYNGIANLGAKSIPEAPLRQTVLAGADNEEADYEVLDKSVTTLPQANQPLFSHLMFHEDGFLGRGEEKEITFPITQSGLYRVHIRNPLLVNVPSLSFSASIKCGKCTDHKDAIYANEEWNSQNIHVQNMNEEGRSQNDLNGMDHTNEWKRTLHITLKSHVILGIKQVPFHIRVCSEYEKCYYEDGTIVEDEVRMIESNLPRGIYKVFVSNEEKEQNFDVEIDSQSYRHHEKSLRKGYYKMIASPYFSVTSKQAPLMLKIKLHAKVFIKHKKPGKYRVAIVRAQDGEIELSACELLNNMAAEMLNATNEKDGDRIKDILVQRWRPCALKSFKSNFLLYDMEKIMQTSEIIEQELDSLIDDAKKVIPDDAHAEGNEDKILEMKKRVDNFFIHSEILVDMSLRAKKFLRMREKKREVKQRLLDCLHSLASIIPGENFANCEDSSTITEKLETLQSLISLTMKQFGNDADEEVQHNLRYAKQLNLAMEKQLQLISQLNVLIRSDNVASLQPFLLRNKDQLAKDAYQRGMCRLDALLEAERRKKLEEQQERIKQKDSEKEQVEQIVQPCNTETAQVEIVQAMEQESTSKKKCKKSLYEKRLALALKEKQKKLQEYNKLTSSVFYVSPNVLSETLPHCDNILPNNHEQNVKQLHSKMVDLMKLASQYVDRAHNGKLIVYFEYPFAELIETIVNIFTNFLVKDRQMRKKEKSFLNSLIKKDQVEELEIVPITAIIRGLSAEGLAFIKEFEKLAELKQLNHNENDLNSTSLLVQYALHVNIMFTLLSQLMHSSVKVYRQQMYTQASVFNSYDADTLTAVFGLIESIKFTFEYFNRTSNVDKLISRVKKITVVDESETIHLDPVRNNKSPSMESSEDVKRKNNMMILLKQTRTCVKEIIKHFIQCKQNNGQLQMKEMGDETKSPYIGTLMKKDLAKILYNLYLDGNNRPIMEVIHALKDNLTDNIPTGYMTRSQLEAGLKITDTFILNVLISDADFLKFIMFISYCINCKLLCQFIRSSTNFVLLEKYYSEKSFIRNQIIIDNMIKYLEKLEKLPIHLDLAVT